jgi:hypothetical protein
MTQGAAAVEPEASPRRELAPSPGARPRDQLTSVGAWGAIAAASRPAPFHFDPQRGRANHEQ